MRKLFFILLMSLLCLELQAVLPQKWELRMKEDFLKGKFEGVSVSSEGILTLAPREEKIEGPAEEFYLSFAFAVDGTAYLGTGHDGKIYKIGKDGKAELYFQAPEMDVTALVVDSRGNVYAGTSPNGKIYKMTAKGKGEPFFNPDEKYIWELLFADDGSLLAAVGESGGIYRISPQGEGKLILKVEQNHILCLKFDSQGNLLAGSGGNGQLYRMTKMERPSLLFESPYEEIKSIAFDGEGNIYVAAAGAPSKAKKESSLFLAAAVDMEVTVTPQKVTSEAITPSPAKEPSALYRIDAQGMVKKIWESSEELIYSLFWKEEEGKLLFGTGNEGRVYAIDKDEKWSLLLQKNSEQVYDFISSDGKIYILANNPPYLGLLYGEQNFSGEYLSQVFDTRTLSSWGKISWEGSIPLGTSLLVQTRSGNSAEPTSAWSEWSPPYQKKEGEQILSPRARYIQFKALLKTSSGKISPALQNISLFYLQTNIAPAIAKLELLPANEVYLKPPDQEEAIWGLEEDLSEKAKKRDEIKPLALAKKAVRKGYQTLLWEAEDENGDSLLFTIAIKKEGDKEWRLLESRWTLPLYAFDTISFPDGAYFLKITASDLPSNPKGTELVAEKTSSLFIIDNSAPVVKNFQALREKNKVDIIFEAEDSFSFIKEVKYLVRPDEWRVVFPADGVCDSKTENFRFTIALPSDADNLITIRIRDSYDNVGVFRKTF